MELELPEQRPGESMGDYAHRTLRRNIIEVRLPPGECVSPVDVAKLLSVSRNPVQSAFVRLESEGLLDVYPQRGSYVSKIDVERVYEGVYLRNLMDQAALKRLCALRVGEEGLALLEENIRLQTGFHRQGQLAREMELDNAFHEIVYRLAGMEHTRSAVESIAADYHRARQLKALSSRRWEAVLGEHQAMVEALRERDGDRACRLSHEHLSRLGRDIRAAWQKHPGYFSNWSEELTDSFRSRMEIYQDFRPKRREE